jgi:ABC-type polysaccharide/polyol phosphate export permease
MLSVLRASIISLKGDFRKDKFGFLFHAFFPVFVGYIVGFVWGNSGLERAAYVAFGYCSWDFFARCLLDGAKQYRTVSITLDSSLCVNKLILENFLKFYFRFSLSYLLCLIFFGNNYLGIFLIYILFFVFGLFAYLVAIISVAFLPAIQSVITVYSRVGLFISPIFWSTESSLIYLNPSTYSLILGRSLISVEMQQFSILMGYYALGSVGVLIFLRWVFKYKIFFLKRFIKIFYKYG